MKKLTTVLLILCALPAAAQQQELTPLQQFLYNESGYAPPSMGATVEQAYEAPTYAQQPQVYAPASPQISAPQQQAYAPPPQQYYGAAPQNAAPDGYYEDTGSAVGPSTDSPGLRALLTSSGF
jgi:hypothetical protein